MNIEEKKAIENAKREFDNTHYLCDIGHKDLGIILNLIEKQQKEIEHQKEKRENQKQELVILNAKQIEFNKLVNTVNSYKGQFKRQQKEIEELKRKERLIKTYKGNLPENVELICLCKNDFERNISEDYISKAKIKAKIEEVKDGTYDAKIVLQSLLEKE